jgi:hypothetical protein
MKKSFSLLTLILLFNLASAKNANALGAGTAGLLSVVPGLGQVAEGNPLEGLCWFTAVVGSLVFANSVHISEPVSGTQTKLLSQAGYDLWLYNIYDAYRDAKPQDGNFSNENALQNYTATFNPLNLGDVVGTPALGIWTSGFGIGNKAYQRITFDRALFFGFVGMGEEGLFRGFLFPALSTSFNSKVVGAITSSILFSLFHITNGVKEMESNFAQRFAMGCIFSFEADRNHYDLRHQIFAHSWIDIINEAGAIKGESTYQVNWHIPLF